MPNKPEAIAGHGPAAAHAAHGATVVKRVAAKSHDDDHGGAWKVAFADFCLALLCLFLVLWLMAARDQEKASQAVHAAGGELVDEGMGRHAETVGSPRGSLIERNPVPAQGDTLPTRRTRAGAQEGASDKPPIQRKRYESAAELAEVAAALNGIAADADLAANVQTVITPQGLRVLLHDTDRQGMFERGSALPNGKFRTLLRALGPLFAQIENQLLVVGHTDSLAYVDATYGAFSNWALSSDRAMAARKQLLIGGMPAASVLQVVGMADSAPLDAADTRADVNRRIELLVLTPEQARGVAGMFGAVPRPVADSDPVAALRRQLNVVEPATAVPGR